MATRITIAAIAAIALVLASCGPDPTQPMRTQTNNAQPVGVQGNPRVEVSRIGVIRDDIAYQDRRGIYLIKDTVTGQEFIGVSGVGITEIGRHGGKHPRSDER
jgi:hypothetical protein